MKTLNILVGCEESQVICSAFRDSGFNAFSCDLKPTRGNPDFHFQDDIFNVLPLIHWDLVILHPDCTAMCVSGNRWYGSGMPKHDYRLKQIEWTLSLWDFAKQNSSRVALENPVSVIFKHLPNVQYVQPWQFGHGECKKTGFALFNLPRLLPTQIVSGRNQRVWRMPPSKNRKRDRSCSYPGIASAMVSQWGSIL